MGRQTKHQMDKIWQLECFSMLKFSILMRKVLLIPLQNNRIVLYDKFMEFQNLFYWLLKFLPPLRMLENQKSEP